MARRERQSLVRRLEAQVVSKEPETQRRKTQVKSKKGFERPFSRGWGREDWSPGILGHL